MKLQDLLGYSNRKGNAAWFNFKTMMFNRMRKWVKTDKDAMHRLYGCRFESEYEWATDTMYVHVLYGGKHIFTLTDPDDHEQLNALSVTLRMLEDHRDDQLSGTLSSR